jgi:hypothetical protein
MGVWRVFRCGSAYNGVELEEVDFEQSADVMYLAHIDHPPTKLLRYDHADWEFMEVVFGPTIDAPASVAATPTVGNDDSTLSNGEDNENPIYFPQTATYVVTSVNDTTGQESRASNTDTAVNDLTLRKNYNTITWTAATDADRYNVYKSDNTRDYGFIGSTESVSFVDDNIGPELTNGPPAAQNPFPAADDYPSTVTFFEQRLLLARTRNRPNAIFGSKPADFENFDTSRPLKPNDAFSLGLVAGRVNAVNQLVSTTSLLALTSDSIFKVDGAGDDGILTATQPRARRQIGRGSSRLGPLVIDNVTFYRPSTGPGVRTLGFSFELDSIQSTDIGIFSPHLFRGFEITSWAYAQEPDSLIWAVRDDGKLLCFTWQQEQQVWGWTLCETDGLVESVCTISENGEDRLYLIVRRTIDETERVFIERMASATWDSVTQSCYLDCAVSFFDLEEPQSVFSGLWHLEGATVWAIADGSVVKNLTVTNGSITLPSAAGEATNCTIGLPFTALIETLPLVLPGGSNLGKRQQLGQATVQLINSGAPMVGPDEGHLYQVKSRSDEDYGDPDNLLNGAFGFDNANVVSGTVSLVIEQELPLPLHLTAAFLDPVVSEPG